MTIAGERQYHPVRDYIESLPAWDGVPRVETLFVDYLGAADTAYTRAVARKTLVAAIARVYQPGIKFDSVVVFNGQQGMGKSSFFAKLGGKWLCPHWRRKKVDPFPRTSHGGRESVSPTEGLACHTRTSSGMTRGRMARQSSTKDRRRRFA